MKPFNFHYFRIAGAISQRSATRCAGVLATGIIGLNLTQPTQLQAAIAQLIPFINYVQERPFL